MRWHLAALVLAGCNPVFDLRPTALDELVPIDAVPIDAPPTCPPPGTSLVFSKYFTQAFSQEVRDYTYSTSSQLALAQCQMPYELCEGRLGERMVTAAGFVAPAMKYLAEPRLSAAGDVALLKAVGVMSSFVLYARGPDGVWTFAADTELPPDFSASASQPTRGPDRHVIILDASGTVDEWVQGTPWTKVASYTLADLGVASIQSPRISGDGLRMLAYGELATDPEFRTLYFDRASIADRWNPAVTIEGVPGGLNDAVLEEDCSRIYFSALGSVFFLPRVP